MRRFLVYLIVWICFAVSGLARASDGLLLLAEDTKGMTRIEFNVGEAPFSLEQPEFGVIDFVTPNRFSSVNLSQLTSGGSARRIANAGMVTDDNVTRLRFVLNCDCGFDFGIKAGILSLRIKDYNLELSEIAESSDSRANENPTKRNVTLRQAPDQSPWPIVRPTMKLDPEPTAKPSVLASVELSKELPLELASTRGEAAEAKLATEKEITLARDHLMQQLSRAADQGLIQFVSDQSVSPPPEVAELQAEASIDEQEKSEEADKSVAEMEPIARPSTKVDAEESSTSLIELPIRARTAVDKEFQRRLPKSSIAKAFCIDKARLDIASWELEGPFLETTLRLRSQLLDEFDQPVPDVVDSLVKHYIVNGFGAEAHQLLTLYGEYVEDADTLVDLAKIVDFEEAQSDGKITRTEPCHAKAVLWRRLSGFPGEELTALSLKEPESQDLREQQMLNAFAELPAVTRRFLGPRLMGNLLDKGELALAKQLDLILLRGQVPQDVALTLSRARLLIKTGQVEDAEALYSSLSETNHLEAQTALILLLESRINRGAEGSQQLSEALGDAAFSARNTPMELPLKVAEIRSRTMTDGPSKALDTLKSAIERSGEDSKLLRDVGHAALEQLLPINGDFVDYAKAVMAIQPFISSGPSADAARHHVAETLTNVGLPNLALEYLKPTSQRSGQRFPIVRAHAMLALGRAAEVLSILQDQTGEDAIRLKANALERLGRFKEAVQVSSQLTQEEDEVRSARAFRAGDWAAAASTGDGPNRPLATFMASQEELSQQAGSSEGNSTPLKAAEPDSETTLGSVQSAIDASQAARSTILEALEDG